MQKIKNISFKLIQLFLITLFLLIFMKEGSESLNHAVIAIVFSNWLLGINNET